jgi:hypothetical protein
MRPFVALLGFVLGSAASITFSLFGVAVVVFVLQSDYPRLDGELAPLLSNLAIFVVLTAAAALSFYSEIKLLAWRRASEAVLLLALTAAGLYYWPA